MAPQDATAPFDASDGDASSADANDDAAPPTTGGAQVCLSQWPQPDGIEVNWSGVATDATGNAYAVFDFDHGQLPADPEAGAPSPFNLGAPPSRVPNGFAVAKFDGACNLVWVREYGPQSGGTFGADALGVATDAQGNVTIAGYFEGSIDLGAGIVTAASGVIADGFLLRLAPSGTTVFAKTFLDTRAGTSFGVSGPAVTPAGVSTIAVDDNTDTDFGSGQELSLLGPQAEDELVQFDGAGNVLFRKPDSSINPSIGTVTQIVTNASGFLWTVGTEPSIFSSTAVRPTTALFGVSASGTYAWEEAPVTNAVYPRIAAGAAGAIVYNVYDAPGSGETLTGLASDGATAWTTTTPSELNGSLGFVVDGKGYPVVLGSFQGTATSGSASPVTSVGNEDLAYQVFDSTGHLVSIGSWGTPGNDRYAGVGVDASGNIVMTSASSPLMAEDTTSVSFVKLAR
jgi:hypothetical protein